MASLPAPLDVAAAARVADLLSAARLVDRELPGRSRRRRRGSSLHVCYLLPRVEVGGGAGVLLEQADQLARLGARVTVVSRFPEPSWFPLQAAYLQVPFGEPIEDAVPACDLVVAGHWEFVLPARLLGLAPVVHLEQGGFHLFDRVPDQLERVVSASVRAADATYALGRAATEALARRFGVQAVELASAVDTTVFRPGGPRRPGHSRSVLVVGWDGPRTWALDDARRIVAALAESHPDVRPVLVTSLPPAGAVDGELLVAPSRQELARRYQEADVCVSCSRDAASPLVPLKAMASGTPVAATATDGVMTSCEDGTDALVAPIGEVDAMVANVRRLLDDPALAGRIAAAARSTAEGHAWQTAARDLLAGFEDLAATSGSPAPPVVPVLAGFVVGLDGVRFEKDGSEELLRARLEACRTRELAIPVAQPVLPGHLLFRWRTVGWRPDGDPGTTRVYLPARTDSPVADSPYQEGIDLLRARRGGEALEAFVGRCRQAGRAEQAVLGRWVVLALLAAGRSPDAVEVSTAFAREFPSHPDYLYLGVVAAVAARRPVDVNGPLRAIELLGRGGRFDEWFDDPAGLLRAHLASA